MQYKFKFRFKLLFNGKELKEMKVTVKAANEELAKIKMIEAVAKQVYIKVVSAVAEVHIEANSKADAQEQSKKHINNLFFNPKEN